MILLSQVKEFVEAGSEAVPPAVPLVPLVMLLVCGAATRVRHQASTAPSSPSSRHLKGEVVGRDVVHAAVPGLGGGVGDVGHGGGVQVPLQGPQVFLHSLVNHSFILPY